VNVDQMLGLESEKLWESQKNYALACLLMLRNCCSNIIIQTPRVRYQGTYHVQSIFAMFEKIYRSVKLTQDHVPT
jgi:hypothetical protein